MSNKHFSKQLGSAFSFEQLTHGNSHRSKLPIWAMISWWIVGIGILILIGLGVLWWVWEPPLASPLSGVTSFQFLNTLQRSVPKTKPIVYGFLPYWNLQKTTIQPELTHLSYFGLTIGGDGQIVTQTPDGTEPGYSKLQSDQWLELANQVKNNQGKIEIVLAQFNADTIVAFLGSDAAHDRLLTSLDSILLAYPVNGINIDLEYNGTVTPQVRDKLTSFMHKLRKHINQKYKHVTLSIDVYASAAKETQLWDIPALSKEVDYFVVMAYDFHRRSSPVAGPVAPLFGGDELWSQDINHYMKSFLSQVSPKQILLGIPFYGYEWQTTALSPLAQTFPDTGATVTYEKSLELLKNKSKLRAIEHWHENALAPYITYQEDGKNYVAHYENARSLAYKLEYAKQLDLAGIAIWAIGYEGESRDLWDPIKQSLF